MQKFTSHRRIVNDATGAAIDVGDTLTVIRKHDVGEDDIVVAEVFEDGHGVGYDETVAGQNFQAVDIREVHPKHNWTCASGASS